MSIEQPVRLSSLSSGVTLLQSDLFVGRDLNFSAIFLHRLIAQGLGQFELQFWAEIRRSSKGSCQLNTKGYEKLAFSTNISRYFENSTRYGHSYNGSYNGRRIGIRMRYIE